MIRFESSKEDGMEACCRGCQRPMTTDETWYFKQGIPYCCAACANGAGCTCAPVARAAAPPRRQTFRLDRAIPLEAHLNDWQS